MILKELRFSLPMTVDEYKLGRFFTMRQRLAQEDSVERLMSVVSNLPFKEGSDSGRYVKYVCQVKPPPPPAPPMPDSPDLPEYVIPPPSPSTKSSKGNKGSSFVTEVWVTYPRVTTIVTYRDPEAPPSFAFTWPGCPAPDKLQVDTLFAPSDCGGMQNAFSLHDMHMGFRTVSSYDLTGGSAPRGKVMTVYKLIRCDQGGPRSSAAAMVSKEERYEAGLCKEICQNQFKYLDSTLEGQLKEVEESEFLDEKDRARLRADISVLM